MLSTHGKEVAEHVASFEARQIGAIKALVKREDVDCDFEETRVVDVCLYKKGKEKIKADLERVVDADISTARDIGYSEDREAEQVCHTRSIQTFLHPPISGADWMHRCLVCGGPSPASHTMPLVCGRIDL